MAEVIVVGGGPTGMMLAGELALGGVDVEILERRSQPELAGSRAGGFHSRTLEVLDQRGIVDRVLAKGQTAQTARFGTAVLDISDFPTRHPYGLALWQNQFEPILADWIEELGVRVRRGREVVGLKQDEAGVEVELAGGELPGGETIRAKYLVGADGGRSVVRKAAGIGFPGWAATRSNLIAEVEVVEEPPVGIRQDEAGVHGLSLLADGRTYRVVTTEQQLGPATEPTLADLGESLRAVFGTDFGVHSPTWISRFTDSTRQASAYRDRRVLIAGDAAHIHYPTGGQGIGLGVQDAVNLGWKLAQVVRGVSPDSLLDTYRAERHPVAERALKHSMAQTVLQRADPRTVALTETMAELLTLDEPRIRIAALIHGLDIAYDFGPGHPLLGRRMPDLDLERAEGVTRVYAYLHGAKPLLLNFGAPGSIRIAGWAHRVQLVDASYAGEWELPVLGRVQAPTAVLVRPDGYVAWADPGAGNGLDDALERWFGRPTAGE
ncbi:MAG: FAD-dependent monooxygenase [Leifsonia sp.]